MEYVIIQFHLRCSGFSSAKSCIFGGSSSLLKEKKPFVSCIPTVVNCSGHSKLKNIPSKSFPLPFSILSLANHSRMYPNILKIKRLHVPFSFLKALPPSKQQNSFSSISPFANPHDNSNTKYFPSTSPSYPSRKINLVPRQYQNAPSDQHELDTKSSNMMINHHVRSGDLYSALKVFERMTYKSTVTWNSILSGYSKMPGKIIEARKLFDQIPDPDIVSYNTMLICYLRSCGIEAARSFFDGMPIKDTASWNTMISGFSLNGMMGLAYELFRVMPERNNVSWNAVISGFIATGDLNSAVMLFRVAPGKCVVAWTAMVTGYMKFGKVELAERLFDEMPEKNSVTWNAMIAGYVENCRWEDGLKLFRRMLGCRVRPNPSTMCSVLLGCSNLSALKLGKQLHQHVYKSPLYLDTNVGTSLISMFCKCGDLDDAWKLFLEMSCKDIVTWNAMISGYAQHGAGKKALGLFDRMRNEGMKPDWITFVGVLLACNHSGLVDLGMQYFEKMQSHYMISARPDHYTCVVDLLGRAGRLAEALDLIQRMPYRPHAAIFGTLLGACRIHKNLEVAEFAAKSLLECDPTSAAGYVQLANVYAAMNKWDSVSRIRRSMKDNKVIKFPGYSWIEVKSVVHEFRSGDRIHPELDLIREKLSYLEKKMKLAGYVPNLEFALHDVRDEQKEKLLQCHSERLAIAFGLIKLSSRLPIRVFKNLRVCGDCHEVTKFISAIEGREIIVRDTTRFHYFRYGKCSCGDYW